MYRNPETKELHAYKLSVFRNWVRDGAISAETAATTRLWLKGADEATGLPIVTVLAQNPS